MLSISSQRGSAIVDFVLVSFPMLFLFVSTVTLTLFSYAKTVVLDATVEGARFAALADQNVSTGASKVTELIQQSIGSLLQVEVSGSEQSVGDSSLVYLESRAFIPGLATRTSMFTVSSLATRETFG